MAAWCMDETADPLLRDNVVHFCSSYTASCQRLLTSVDLSAATAPLGSICFPCWKQGPYYPQAPTLVLQLLGCRESADLPLLNPPCVMLMPLPDPKHCQASVRLL